LSDILVDRSEFTAREADEVIRKIAQLCSRRELDEWWQREIGWSPERDSVGRKARMRFAELSERAKRSGREQKWNRSQAVRKQHFALPYRAAAD
jgi:hypothetical protein